MLLTSYLIVRINTQGAQVTKVALVALAILFEVISLFGLVAGFRKRKEIGFSRTYLPERFGTLTLIVVGEGVIGLLSHLEQVLGGFGFGANSIIAIILSVLIVYFTW